VARISFGGAASGGDDLAGVRQTCPILILPISGVLATLASTAVIVEDIIRIKTGNMPESCFEHRFDR